MDQVETVAWVGGLSLWVVYLWRFFRSVLSLTPEDQKRLRGVGGIWKNLAVALPCLLVIQFAGSGILRFAAASALFLFVIFGGAAHHRRIVREGLPADFLRRLQAARRLIVVAGAFALVAFGLHTLR